VIALRLIYLGIDLVTSKFWKGTIIFVVIVPLFGQTKEEFDPSRIKDIPVKWPRIYHSFLKESSAVNDTSVLDTSISEVDGFRVQVFATGYSRSADSLKTILEHLGYKDVYIAFDTPVYKVRVGNFVSRNEAEKTRENLVKQKFDTAWIVRSKVFARKFRLIESMKH